jgi:hypothetical protein
LKLPGFFAPCLPLIYVRQFLENNYLITIQFFVMKNIFHITIEDANALLNNAQQRFVQVLQNGMMKVEYYVPQKTDEQTPHKQDVLYIVVSGNSGFYRNGETIKCKKAM